MKHILTFSLFLIVFSTNAQEWSVKGGYTASFLTVKEQTLKINSDWTFLSDYHLSTGLNIPLNRFFSIQTGLSLNNVGGHFTEKDEDYSYHLKYRFTYLQTPILFQGQWQLKRGSALYGIVGAYAAYAVKGRQKERIRFGENIEFVVEPLALGNNVYADFRRWDAGVSTGIGWRYKRFFVETNYTQGLMNLSPSMKQNILIRQRYLSLSTGFVLLSKQKKGQNAPSDINVCRF